MTRALLLLTLSAAWAAAPRAQIVAGDAMPQADAPLEAVGGGTRTLAAEAGPAGLVVVFWSNTCPWGDRYASRVGDLAATYGPAGVGIVLVNSNAPDQLEAESAAAGRVELSEKSLSVPYLLDAGGAVAAAFGARRAPHAFLFGADGRLLYDGAIDDSPSSAERVERPYLREALDQSVAGLPVAVQKTQPFGCRTRATAPTPDPEPPTSP